MKKILLAMLVTASALLAGCSTSSSPVMGAINVAKWDGAISNPGVNNKKTSKACAQSILGLVAFGDASIETAKATGGITKVATVDHETLNILFIFGQYCAVVTGE
jgi:hypothetical protein